MLGVKQLVYGSIPASSIRRRPLRYSVAGLSLGTAHPWSAFSKSTPIENRRYGSSLPDTSQVEGVDYGVQDVVTSSAAPSTSVLLAALFGLPLALWAYKCLMMVMFQRKIIYMGYIPPGARTETLVSNDPLLSGLKVEKIVVASDPGIKLEGFLLRNAACVAKRSSRRVVIVYFQGNVGSPIQRLPIFRKLCLAGESANGPFGKLDLEVIAVPPRSYGLSTNARPNQRALLSDYRAVVQHVATKYAELDKRDGVQTKIVWYGHSLGASIATCLLASVSKQDFDDRKIVCDGLIFENGFASIKGMVRTLYPQRFLPYYWLTPFVMDDWNAIDAFQTNKEAGPIINTVPKLFVVSEKDEMVPPEMVKRVYGRAVEHGKLGVPCEWLGVKDAMHDFAYQKSSWLSGITRFIANL